MSLSRFLVLCAPLLLQLVGSANANEDDSPSDKFEFLSDLSLLILHEFRFEIQCNIYPEDSKEHYKFQQCTKRVFNEMGKIFHFENTYYAHKVLSSKAWSRSDTNKGFTTVITGPVTPIVRDEKKVIEQEQAIKEGRDVPTDDKEIVALKRPPIGWRNLRGLRGYEEIDATLFKEKYDERFRSCVLASRRRKYGKNLNIPQGSVSCTGKQLQYE